MASTSERSPPPFPDSEDQDVLDSGDVGGRGSDEDDGEDLFMSVNEPPMTDMDITLPSSGQFNDDVLSPPGDLLSDPFIETAGSQTETEPAGEIVSEPSDDFVDLTNNLMAADDTSAPVNADAAEGAAEIPPDEPSDDFVDILGSETEAPQEEVVERGDAVEAETAKSEELGGIIDPLAYTEQEAKQTVTPPMIDILGDSTENHLEQPHGGSKIADPLVDLLGEPAPAEAKAPGPGADLFEDEGIDLFAEPRLLKSSKQPQKSLFGDPDEDLFGESAAKKPPGKEQDKSVAAKPAAVAVSSIGGPLQEESTHEDIFTQEAVATAPAVSKTQSLVTKTNGAHSEEDTDIFADATVELSLDSPQTSRRKDVSSKPAASAASPAAAAAASLAKPQAAALEELDEEEEEELEDTFDIVVSVTDPEKIGDGMNAYMAYRVSTQTSLSMFRNKSFSVRRRFSDFLGLYEKLAEKHGPNGFIVPPPPEKNLLGMTKMKVGKEDSSSADFLERRRGALERYLQRVVCHPSLLQDPDVREFLEREELPRAVSTQALSGAGFLKMINKATDAVSKMTIKMNESDVWFEEKLQEVEAADQHFRKLHLLVESLVLHRKELSLNTASFAKSAAMLGSAEDNTALSRALSQLAEVEDKMEQLHQDQASNDTFRFAEQIADFIRLLGAVRGSFDHRMKAWQRWQDAQAMLQKKREAEAKLLWANKPDKLQLAKEEITEWEAKVTQYERDFERVSATVRKEVTRFEQLRAKNFKRQIIQYLEALLQSQQQLIKYWEGFLPEAKAIA